MLSDLDTKLDALFDHYGFYESDKVSKKEFKKMLVRDYLEFYGEVDVQKK